MYEFWYDYVKPINGLKEKLYYKDTIFYSLHTKKRRHLLRQCKRKLKQELILQSMNLKGHYLKEKVKI